MPNGYEGFAALGQLAGGRIGTPGVYEKTLGQAYENGLKLEQARRERANALIDAVRSQEFQQLPSIAQELGYTDAQGRLLQAGGGNASQLTGALGDLQEQGFRGGAVDAALGGDWNGANARLVGVTNGPVEVNKLTDGIATNPYQTDAPLTVTPLGEATIAQRAAAARASDASAQSSLGRLGIAQAQFGLQQAGQWNPSGATPAAGGGAKPLPVGALKEVLGTADALGNAQNVIDMTQRHLDRINSGELTISPASAASAWIRTKTGFSDANTINYNELKADKTRIVNESLRLNKGVQTEGDAQRAVNELMASDDQASMTRALQRLQGINQRAIALQRQKAALIYGNYGRDADGEPLGTPPAARAPGLPGYTPTGGDQTAVIEQEIGRPLSQTERAQIANGTFQLAIPTSASVAMPGAPRIGEVQEGYRFLGGDPSNPANWERL